MIFKFAGMRSDPPPNDPSPASAGQDGPPPFWPAAGPFRVAS